MSEKNLEGDRILKMPYHTGVELVEEERVMPRKRSVLPFE